ncbi:MAG TPA: hypothetical protein VD997_11025 [Phycisphaerales bacterium]|nr:hypothetical protein [Phycisphaerales bacterium]
MGDQPGGERVEWSGRLWPMVWPCLLVVGGFSAMFALGIERDRPAGADAAPGLLFAVLFPFCTIGLLLAGAIALTARYVAATAHELVIRTWVGRPRRLARAEVLGIRFSRSKVRGKPRISHLYVLQAQGLTSWFAPPEWTRDQAFTGTLERLFGPIPGIRAFDEAVQSASAPFDARTHVALFPAIPKSRPLVCLEWACVAATSAVLISVAPLIAMLTDPDLRWDGPSFQLAMTFVPLLMCIAFAVGLLKTFDLLRGGELRAIAIAPDGLRLQRRWRTRLIPAERIAGISYSHPLTADLQHGTATVHLRYGRWAAISLLFHERNFDAPPAALTHALVRRFGMYEPPQGGVSALLPLRGVRTTLPPGSEPA